MGDPCPQVRTTRAATSTTNAPPTSPLPVSLVEPSPKKKRRNGKTIKVFRSIFRSFPILTPTACKFPALPGGALPDPHRGIRSGTKVTGTLFGYRQGMCAYIDIVITSIYHHFNYTSTNCKLGLIEFNTLCCHYLKNECSNPMVRSTYYYTSDINR